MERRAFVGLIAGGLLSAPLAARGQQPRVPRIGYLRFIGFSGYDESFRTGLRELGYVVGQNLHIEVRDAGGSIERLTELATELVGLKVDILVAASTQAVEAARRATTTIPIVFPVTFDPVEAGYVASLGRPGGNLTGLTPLNPTVTAKRVELLREMIPRISRVAVLRNPTNPGSAFPLRETQSVAQRLGVRIQVLNARTLADVEVAFAAAARERAEAIMVFSDNLFFSQKQRVVDLGVRHRLPEMFDTSDFVAHGGLVSYGADLHDLFRRAASYVDKILRGASPATLPVEQATKFELVINLKTAQTLRLTIPAPLLARADRVIE